MRSCTPSTRHTRSTASHGRCANRIEGIGIGFVPPRWEPDAVDAIEAASAHDAFAMARRLAREEGLFAGASSGANVTAALRVAAELGADATVVAILCDSGLRYLSTDVPRSLTLERHGGVR